MAYDRYWDLHLTHSNGFYDFADTIAEQVTHQSNKPNLNNTVTLIGGLQQGQGARVIWAQAPGALPVTGVVASMARLDVVNNFTASPAHRSLVAWINNGAHQGKLRLNCHGDGMGQIGMKDGQGGFTWIAAEAVVDWLARNGLGAGGVQRQARLQGLKNINVAVCMAERAGVSPATYSSWSRTSSAAVGSAVERIVSRLRALRIHGVEVTGSNEITVSANGVVARVLGVGMAQAPDAWNLDMTQQGTYFIDIPDGWTVTSFRTTRGGEVTIPALYALNPEPANPNREPSGGWILTHNNGASPQPQQVGVPGGWILDEQRRIIKPPLGWNVTSRGGNRGGRLSPPPGAGLTERLAHSPYKVRELS